MKNIFFGLIFALNITAALAGSEQKHSQPSEEKIQSNRACFNELEVQGCGSPNDDQTQFRSCLSNVLDSLDTDCKGMMLSLYGSN